jgi:SAM-dependent methyltransferase
LSGTTLEKWAARIVSHPAVYRLVQNLAGQARVAARLRSALAEAGPGARLLDVGSAEGGFAARLGIDPVFVDLDPRPLAALLRRRRGSRAAAADATALPFADGAFDVSLCVAVTHHLDDRQLELVVADLARVTRRHLVFLDAVRNDGRALSRWMWKLDRGRYPRTREQLREALERRFTLSPAGEFTVYHQYALWVASPR